MGSLSYGDLRALHAFAGDVGECQDVAGFSVHALALLRRLIECNTASYNEVGSSPDEITAVTDPAEHAELPGVIEGFARYAGQSPLVTLHQRTPLPDALRLSDFIGLRALRRLDLYREVYAPLEIEHQLAVTLPAQSRVIGLTVNRGGRDFSDREVELLDAAGPLLRAAHRNLTLRAELETALAALEQAAGGAHAVLLVGAGGALQAAHGPGERLLAALDRDRTAADALRGWARAERRARRAGGMLRLTICERPHSARYVRSGAGRPDAVVVSPEPEPPHPGHLRGLGLSAREAEVLYLVWLGHGNARIAASLGLSEHTVRHHLEHVYRRLGVGSRAAAAQRATACFAAVAGAG
jgi:DNA-binding CsgD family transcriptional regulator